MKKAVLMAVGMMTVALHAHAISTIVNPGFETGDLTGWDTNLNGGVAEVVSSASTLTAPSGNYFLCLTAGDANAYVQAAQFFYMSAGEQLSGFAAFETPESSPTTYNDDALALITFLSLSGGATTTELFSQSANSGGSTLGWVSWSFTAATSGYYALQFGVENVADNLNDSKAYFDIGPANANAATVPDGGSTAALFGLALVGIEGARRKLRVRDAVKP